LRQAQTRVFYCARCDEFVWICRRCDRGNRYCSPECASLARSESTRDARCRYRNSDAGRTTQKFRQRRFRCAPGKAVTDQSSASTAPCENLDPSKGEERAQISSDSAGNWSDRQSETPAGGEARAERPGATDGMWMFIRCHFCGRICGMLRLRDHGSRRDEQGRQKGRQGLGEAQEEKEMDRDT